MDVSEVRKNRDKLRTWRERKKIAKEFEQVINQFSLEGDSNTPDFILADYLVDCLINFHLTVATRKVWYNAEDKK